MGFYTNNVLVITIIKDLFLIIYVP